MSREAYLFFNAREPAGVVRDWPEFCDWARRHKPLGRALGNLINRDKAMPAADVERDLLACFDRAVEWPLAAEQFLEAVLGRLFDNPTIGFDYNPDPPAKSHDPDDDGKEEEDDEAEEPQPVFDFQTKLIFRLLKHTAEGDEQTWRPLRERALLLAVIARLLVEPPGNEERWYWYLSGDEKDEDGFTDEERRDRRDTELAVALAMLARLRPSPAPGSPAPVVAAALTTSPNPTPKADTKPKRKAHSKSKADTKPKDDTGPKVNSESKPKADRDPRR